MQAPWYIYIVALVVGAPIFFLWGVAAWQLVRGLISWVTDAPPAPVPVKRVSIKG